MSKIFNRVILGCSATFAVLTVANQVFAGLPVRWIVTRDLWICHAVSGRNTSDAKAICGVGFYDFDGTDRINDRVTYRANCPARTISASGARNSYLNWPSSDTYSEAITEMRRFGTVNQESFRGGICQYELLCPQYSYKICFETDPL